MDAFMEKIVRRKMNAMDHAFIGMLYTAALILTFLAVNFIDMSFSLVLAIGAFYGAYWLSGLRKLEFEMAYTNGEIDIDRIVAQRKRKRIFSQNCKEFDLVAKVGSVQYTPQVITTKNIIDASSSAKSDNVWFAVTRYDGKPTVLYFEPSNSMLEAMAIIIPRKLFK